MKKKVKKFAKGGLSGFSPFISAALSGTMGGMGRGSSLPYNMGKFSNMSPRKSADLRSAAQQAGRGSAGAMRGELGPMQPPPGLVAQYVRAGLLDKGQVFKKGGAVKASKSVSSASKRADGIATKGKTRGKMV
jgi:hypothetical protein